MNGLRDLLITIVCHLLSLPFAVLSSRRPANRPFSSIVVIKPCCIGDVVLATPAVAALRQAYPEARLAFVVSSWAIEAVRHNPRIDEIIECGSLGSGRAHNWQEYLSLVRRLRKGSFELAVVLDRSPVLSLVPFLAGIPYRAGVDSGGRGFSLTAKAPWRPDQHEAELYLDAVRALGTPVDGPKAVAHTDQSATDHENVTLAGVLSPLPSQWERVRVRAPSSTFKAEFYPSEGDRQKACAVLASVPAAATEAGGGPRLAMVHPGGAANPGMALSAKRWPAGRYAEIVRRFLKDRWTVLLAGAESDRPTADAVLSALEAGEEGRTEGKLLDLVGLLSLGELAAVAQRCRVFVGNDTGPMHLAAAVGTPTVAIFGPSAPAMYAPFGASAVAVYRKVACSPCFVKGRFATDCRDHRCMQAVAVDDVWQAIKQVAAE